MTKVTSPEFLCTNCEQKSIFTRIKHQESLIIKGEEIIINAEYCKCDSCGDEVLIPGVNPDPFELAYREYRKRHGFLQPEEIRTWRRLHKLTQSELASLLGLGIATLNRYENGAIQNEAHEKLLRLIMDPSGYAKLLSHSSDIFSEAKRKELLETLESVNLISNSVDDSLLSVAGGAKVDEFSGYRKLNLSKLYNVILFFSKEGIFKTKLNKLLFYADFKYFKEYTVSITGARYIRLPYGPVPDNYERYYTSLLSKNSLQTIEEGYPDGEIFELLKTNISPDLSIFDTSEIRILASVSEHFHNYTAGQIKECSHNEVGYRKTDDNKAISYKYASQLSY